jgi:hypothetical protein
MRLRNHVEHVQCGRLQRRKECLDHCLVEVRALYVQTRGRPIGVAACKPPGAGLQTSACFGSRSLTLAEYIERLNATFRERLASLTRRGRALACHTLTLQHGMYLIDTVYNFCTPPPSLAYAEHGTTPAMAADITDQCWTVHALLSFPVPPPRWPFPRQRGRRSRTLQRLIKRWCPS